MPKIQKKSVKKSQPVKLVEIVEKAKNLVYKTFKTKHIGYIFLTLILLGFWFYWSQIRVINIRRQCYSEVFTPTVKNAKWSPGKVWTLMYPAYDPAKGNRFNYTFWGWGYPETDNEVNVYNRCLIWNGLVNSPDFK
jgi:hypothetical protein